jgi:hypothetical protein
VPKKTFFCLPVADNPQSIMADEWTKASESLLEGDGRFFIYTKEGNKVQKSLLVWQV